MRQQPPAFHDVETVEIEQHKAGLGAPFPRITIILRDGDKEERIDIWGRQATRVGNKLNLTIVDENDEATAA